jgi:methionyl-tRNA formyltransferase
LEVLEVICGDGSILGLLKVQPVSKKVMNAKSFFNGLQGNAIKYSIS